jgi:hypothetical protein
MGLQGRLRGPRQPRLPCDDDLRDRDRVCGGHGDRGGLYRDGRDDLRDLRDHEPRAGLDTLEQREQQEQQQYCLEHQRMGLQERLRRPRQPRLSCDDGLRDRDRVCGGRGGRGGLYRDDRDDLRDHHDHGPRARLDTLEQREQLLHSWDQLWSWEQLRFWGQPRSREQQHSREQLHS